MKFNPFRRLTVAHARQRLAQHAAAQAQHHELEALRLRYEIATLTTQAANHDSLAETFRGLAEEHAP